MLSFSGLRPGTEVFCTVLKPSNENLRMLVSVDAVLEEELAAKRVLLMILRVGQRNGVRGTPLWTAADPQG